VKRAGETPAALALHGPEQPSERRRAHPARFPNVSAHDLAAQIRGQHAQGRQNRGQPWHDDAPDLKPARDLRNVDPGGSAERKKREAVRIESAAHRRRMPSAMRVLSTS
jgi:hypothetical protein